jgi:hypothetical protein
MDFRCGVYNELGPVISLNQSGQCALGVRKLHRQLEISNVEIKHLYLKNKIRCTKGYCRSEFNLEISNAISINVTKHIGKSRSGNHAKLTGNI